VPQFQQCHRYGISHVQHDGNKVRKLEHPTILGEIRSKVNANQSAYCRSPAISASSKAAAPAILRSSLT